MLFDGINPGFFVCHRGESFARMIRASYLPCHFAVIIRGLMLPPLYLRAQCCVMMLYRVSGEGGGMEYGCQESITRLVHQPRIFIYYTRLLLVFVTLATAVLVGLQRGFRGEGRLFLHQDS